jgi:hypothetical protein
LAASVCGFGCGAGAWDLVGGEMKRIRWTAGLLWDAAKFVGAAILLVVMILVFAPIYLVCDACVGRKVRG